MMLEKTNKRNISKRGFTLVELMIVIAIAGIMAALTIPAYLSWKPGYVFRGAVSRVKHDVSRAKLKALETRRQSRIEFCGPGYQIIEGNQALNSSWTVPGTSAAPACPMTASQQTAFRNAGRQVTIRNFADFPQVRLTRNCATSPTAISAGSERTFTFMPVGTASSNGTVSVFHNGSRACQTFSLSVAGRVNIQ